MFGRYTWPNRNIGCDRIVSRNDMHALTDCQSFTVTMIL